MKFVLMFPLEPKSWSRPCIQYSIYCTVYLSVVTCAHPPQFLYVADPMQPAYTKPAKPLVQVPCIVHYLSKLSKFFAII